MEANEVHAFVIGFAEGFCLCGAHQPTPQPVKKIISEEYWYYQAGRVAGKVALPLVVIGILLLGKVLLL